MWRNLSKAAQKREKQEWAVEKPKLHNSRKMREIYFIYAGDKECEETIKNARRKLEVHMEAAIPRKKKIPSQLCFQETLAWLGAPNTILKTMYACVVESHESTRQKMESALQRGHVDHIAAKGENSIDHCNLVNKFIPVQKAMKIPDAKAAVEKEWDKLETIQAWKLDTVKSKKEVILEAQKNKSEVHFASLMDKCHLKNA